MKPYALLGLAIIVSAGTLKSQAEPGIVEPILSRKLEPPQIVTYQLQQFLQGKVPALVVPANAEQWTTEAQQIRHRLLDKIIYHGWPQEWISSPPRFQDLGPLPSGKGYTLHRLRYEIVPGFYSTALLYAPETVQGKAPGVLDLMGHFVPLGNKEEFEQKQCINQALKGMVALNLEWIGMGELNTRFDDHSYASQLDLVGLNGVGLFYLAMRRGLDYLAADPRVDPSRLGVTGLSGGGWQTITLSSLDPRVLVSIPVAGFVNLQGRLERLPEEPGDFEQNATDFLVGQDYSTLTAIRAPRPTLLVYNAEDDCCYRAPLVKPYVFDDVVPFFNLYGKPEDFQFFQSTLISAHNDALEDQSPAFAFFIKHFHLNADNTEISVGRYVKSFDELKGGIPDDNLTILGLARKMAGQLVRPSASYPVGSALWADSQRAKLRDVVRYHPVMVANYMPIANTYHDQTESTSYRFEMSNGLSATGVWLKEVQIGNPAPLTIVINDEGKKGAATQLWDGAPEVAGRMERGEQVLAVDLLGMGDAAPDQPYDMMAMMLATTGERPLGMEAAQLISLVHWAQAEWKPSQVRLQGTGIRSQVISLVAAAIEPRLFSQVETREGMHSLSYLLDEPVDYKNAPELFCLDLYKDFDIDPLAELAKPSEVIQRSFVEVSTREK